MSPRNELEGRKQPFRGCGLMLSVWVLFVLAVGCLWWVAEVLARG